MAFATFLLSGLPTGFATETGTLLNAQCVQCSFVGLAGL